MISGSTTGMGAILWKVLRHPLASDLTLEQASEFAIEFIRIIGAPLTFIDKVTNPKLEIINYKVSLPANLINIRGIKYSTDENIKGIPMRYATDLYHNTLDGNNQIHNTEYTYTTQNCVITTSQQKGFLEVSYKSLETDDFGYPIVPDNESFKMGLEYYILHRYLEALWSVGKITDKVFNYYEVKRHFYMGQADSSVKLQGMDHLESVMNSVNRLVVTNNAFNSGYKKLGEREYIKKYH